MFDPQTELRWRVVLEHYNGEWRGRLRPMHRALKQAQIWAASDTNLVRVWLESEDEEWTIDLDDDGRPI